MIERVSRALCVGNPDDMVRIMIVTDHGEFGSQGVLSDEKEPNWHRHRDEARRAIAAMREPTVDMENAGEVHMESGVAANVWESMIDAARR